MKTEEAGGGPPVNSLIDVDSKVDPDTKVTIEASTSPKEEDRQNVEMEEVKTEAKTE